MNATDSDFPDVIISLKRRDDQLERRVEFACGRRNFFKNRIHERLKIAALVVNVQLGNALLGGGVDDGKIKLFVVGVEFHEKFKDFVVNFVDAGFGAVNLVYDDNRLELVFQRLAQDVFGLRHRAFKGVDEQKHAVNHVQHAFDFAAEIRVTGRVDDINLDALVKNRRVLRQNRNAAFAFQVAAVHDAFGYLFVLAEDVALFKHCVDERCFAVVDVRDYCYVSAFGIDSHYVASFENFRYYTCKIFGAQEKIPSH